MKRRQKLGEGKNLEEVNIRKRQKFREGQNSDEGKNGGDKKMEESKIRRRQLENQEKAKKFYSSI